MLITCPNCETSYEVEGAKLGLSGRSVRCGQCKRQWHAVGAADDEFAHLAVNRPAANRPAADREGASSPQAGEGPATPVDSDLAPQDDDAVGWNAPALQTGEPEGDPIAPTPSDAAFAAALEDDDGDPRRAGADILAPAPSFGDDAPPAPDGAEQALSRPGEIALARTGAAAPPRYRFTSAAASDSRRFGVLLGIVIVALLGVLAGLIGWRNEVVRAAPQTAAVYAALGLPVNLRGLSFAGVTLGYEVAQGVPVMVVEGTIVNTSARDADVPRLRFAVRNPARVETYAWTARPALAVLPSGASLPFRTRLASPPPDARDVLVRFFQRADLASGG